MSLRWTQVVALIVAGTIASVVIVELYGGRSFFPGLVAGFIGTLLAFVLALADAGKRERRRLTQDAEQVENERTTEVRRRLEPVSAELQKNEESVKLVAEAFELTEEPKNVEPASVSTPVGWEKEAPFLINPQLLEGAWNASAPRLSELIADYKLIADLGTAYGRIEELRWRLRYRTERRSTILDSLIGALALELSDEVSELLKRVGEQIAQPSVQPLGLLHVKTGGLVAGVTTSATIETKVIRREDGPGGEPNAY